jgi:hypothetical protein
MRSHFAGLLVGWIRSECRKRQREVEVSPDAIETLARRSIGSRSCRHVLASGTFEPWIETCGSEETSEEKGKKRDIYFRSGYSDGN